MNKELIDKAWACLPREFKEEVKDIYLNTVACHPCGYNHKIDLLKYLFGNHNLTSDAEGEEMLTVPRKKVKEKWQRACEQEAKYGRAQDSPVAREELYYNRGILSILDTLFGTKCLPDELNEDNFATKKPQPAEPKFKVGDDVRIVDDSRHGQKYRGDVTEVVYVDESDPDATYKVDIYDEECGVSLWYSESDLEPYTEPTANYMQVDYHGADTAASTIADSCQSQPVTDYFDRIIKDDFRDHNRLHIAAMMVPSVIATVPCSENEKGYAKMVATRARILADALISECKKGGGNA